MPVPIALCLEDLAPARGTSRYLSCVALRGVEPGLTLDPTGAVQWRSASPAACELFVSLDQQLILLRPEGAGTVTVTREGRSLAAPAGKPVVLLDGDEITIAARRLRVHVHGIAPAVAAPAPVKVRERRGARRAAAAALALGAALGCGRGIEVRETPPAVSPQPVPADAGGPASQPAGKPAASPGAPLATHTTAAPAASPADAGVRPDGGKKKPIEVRPTPPKVAPPPGWKGGGGL